MELFDDYKITRGKKVAITIIVFISLVMIIDFIVSFTDEVTNNFKLQFYVKFIVGLSLFHFYYGKKLAYWIISVILFSLYINLILIISYKVLERFHILGYLGGALMLIVPIILSILIYYVFIVKTNLKDDFLHFIRYQRSKNLNGINNILK